MKIELEMTEHEARVLATWLDEGGSLQGALAEDVAHQIVSQIPQPRIPEPGVWGVVEAHTEGYSRRRILGRAPETDDQHWVDEADWFTWDELIDPILIRKGI